MTIATSVATVTIHWLLCVCQTKLTNSVIVKVQRKHGRTVIRGLHYVTEFLHRTLQIHEGSAITQKKITKLLYRDVFTDFRRRSWLAKCRTVSRYTHKSNLIGAHRKSTVISASIVANPINIRLI